MSQPWVDNAKFPMPSTSSAVSDPLSSPDASLRLSNVSRLLALREISPRMKRSSKRFWQQPSKVKTNKFVAWHQKTDARHGLISWVESDSLRNYMANYCPLLPPPRSTIAAAFSSDGEKLASTHGDHTVKVIDSQTGSCLKVLSGHRRTPWVVRFHPLNSEILASGSLDHEVRLWDAETGVCTESYNFYRPIASIAFHAQGQVLAVASGHKLFMWHYTSRRGESFFPVSVLKTKRSLRAVHFHPHAAPLLLTAEVNDLDSPDCPLTLATTSGYPPCPPVVVAANVNSSASPDADNKMSLTPTTYIFWPTILRVGRQPLQRVSLPTGSVNWPQRAELSGQTYPNMGSQRSGLVSSAEVSSLEPSNTILAEEMVVDNSLAVGMNFHTENMDRQHTNRSQHSSSAGVSGRRYVVPNDESSAYQWGSVATSLANRVYGHGIAGNAAFNSANFSGSTIPTMPMRTADSDVQSNPFFPLSNLASWEIPFLQGWVMGQSHAGLHMPLAVNSLQRSMANEAGTNFLSSEPYMQSERPILASSAKAATLSQSRDTGRDSSRHRHHSRLMVAPDTGEASPTELPCTVKLRIWAHDIRVPCSPLDPERCLLIIPHAVLCSEMGAHFSPCGRFLAACVACILPMLEGDHGSLSQINADVSELATSPTRHPFSSQQVIYELRIYSLEKATFGSVLASTAIRAAHCLTSIQFSPTSEHLLLAYGRRHASLRRSHIIDERTAIHTYTIMEVYRVSDMELVSVLPSSDDEVNVACFHPIAGGGLVYGTKEGKLRIFQYDGPRGTNSMGSNSLLETMLEAQPYALEC